MNVYSELLDLLCPVREDRSPVCFGTIAALSPRSVCVAGQTLSRGLVWPRGMVLTEQDLGHEVALLPLPDGFIVLFQVEGGGDT